MVQRPLRDKPLRTKRLMQSKGVPRGSLRLMQSASRGEPAGVRETSRLKVGGVPVKGEPVETIDCAEGDRARIRTLGHSGARDQTHDCTLLVPCQAALRDLGASVRDGRGRRYTDVGRRVLVPEDYRNRLAVAGERQVDFEHVPRLRRGPCVCQLMQSRVTAFPCGRRKFRCAAIRESRSAAALHDGGPPDAVAPGRRRVRGTAHARDDRSGERQEKWPLPKPRGNGVPVATVVLSSRLLISRRSRTWT